LWDLEDDPEGNVQYVRQHGISQEEVEEVLEQPIDEDRSRSTGLPVVFGVTSTGRHLMVVYEQAGSDTIYPVTAYEVPRRGR
jgi:uncharacterized DUF497 family protein